MTQDLLDVVRSTKYPPAAFAFVQAGLDFTVRRLKGEAERDGDVSRHVTGQELCYGLRDFALQQYGVLARTVLRRWGILACSDFGHIVYAMVDAGLMSKTDEDSLDDFEGVYEFTHAFPSELQLAVSELSD